RKDGETFSQAFIRGAGRVSRRRLRELRGILGGALRGGGRLHDTNRSGWLVGFWLILGFATTIVDASAPVPDPEAARELNAQGIALGMAVSWLLLTLVIAVLLALRPTPGPNKYGPQPVKRR
ncbi:MAG: DUF805 domain-containing protein, partial [Thermoguttaceae bacterium]|nr:DUF805 domain-containing protein [Thermoguttaceae bacterium]